MWKIFNQNGVDVTWWISKTPITTNQQLSDEIDSYTNGQARMVIVDSFYVFVSIDKRTNIPEIAYYAKWESPKE
jgi:hypothetical protein